MQDPRRPTGIIDRIAMMPGARRRRIRPPDRCALFLPRGVSDCLGSGRRDLAVAALAVLATRACGPGGRTCAFNPDPARDGFGSSTHRHHGRPDTAFLVDSLAWLHAERTRGPSAAHPVFAASATPRGR